METSAHISGYCYCESIRFEIASGTEVLLNGYCQCSDCRRAHAANLYQYAYVLEEHFSVVAGEDLLRWHVKNQAMKDNFRRYFCSKCGTRTHNFCIVEFGGMPKRLIGVFPSLFEDTEVAKSPVWLPREHINCRESILNLALLHDDLPRHTNVPSRSSF